MRFRFASRRVVVAASAITMALGSAAAYAINLPELPEPVRSTAGKLLDAADNIAGHVAEPRDPGEPEPETGLDIPGTGGLPLVPPGLLNQEPKAAAAKAPKAKSAKKPAASPAEDLLGEILAPLTGTPEHEAPPPPFAQEEPAGDDLDSLLNEPLISVPDASYGHGWNVCNNNNEKHIVNEESNSHNDVDQQNSGGDVVTNIDGRSAPSEDDPDTDCE